MSDPRYPIGKYVKPMVVDDAQHKALVEQLTVLPVQLRKSVEKLTDAQLDTPYRADGWTLRQVVHHVADSHVNAYIRFKFGLTEDVPTIKPYAEGLWAELPEAKTGPVDMSLQLVDATHRRWLACVRGLPAVAFSRTFMHPESGTMNLAQQLALYAWHGCHHVAHITALRQAKGW